METTVKEEECVELKNLKYKTMLLSGVVLKESKSSANDLSNLEKFLEDSKINNQSDPWSKLDKTTKIRKLIIFAKDKNLNSEEESLLVAFLKDALDRKKFQRVKDVDYDKITGEIKDIPAIFYNKPTKHFTLKNNDKRISTLKSLPPKKVNGTIKNNKKVSQEDASDSDKE